MSHHKYYGKFRGTVLNNIDPMQIGRIQAIVPDVSSLIPTTWALPCVPIASPQAGSWFVPMIGSGVWIEFEHGDPDYPIWVGCYWATVADVPAVALAALPGSPNIVLQTTGENTVLISDLPGPTGGIVLKSATGASIIVNEMGIMIENGAGASIAMIGPSVSINEGALEII
jgi:uncharacterized protein involved in type VI secretion and phage assembly